MSGDTTTPPAAATTAPPPTTPPLASETLTPARAARELGLKRRDVELAAHLGRITAHDDHGGVRITREEIERLRAEKGFPDGLRDSVETVGTRAGALIVGVPESRFTRLARLGFVVPVAFYLNRYRTVVWLYLAKELRQFAADPNNAPLLKGRAPESLRRQVTAGADLRPRNWRGRHLGFLLRGAGTDPWARAAALTCLLGPVQVAQIVTDPYERSHLVRLRPALPAHGAPGSPAAELAQHITTACDPDEIGWLRADLAQALDEARLHHPAPRPAPKTHPGADPRPGRNTTGRAHRDRAHTTTGHPRPAPAPHPAADGRPRGLRGWLRRRGAPPTAP
ncbi:MAG TPA: DUF6397 family protein [Streptomyces sp.]|nr:DUF6397 family protein [Streptomyces sp.]